MKTIGPIGSMSWDSTAVCYCRLNELARERLGGRHSASFVMRPFDVAVIEPIQAKGDRTGATDGRFDGRSPRRGAGRCGTHGDQHQHDAPRGGRGLPPTITG